MDEKGSIEEQLKRLEVRVADPQDDKQRALDRLLKFAPLLLISHLFVGLPTLLISLVVAYGTFVQADATKKIQQAEAWPFVSYGSSNIGSDGKPSISLELSNNGVGPALLGPIEISYEGKVVRDPREMLERCCGLRPAQNLTTQTSPASRIVVPPGERTQFLRINATPDNQAIWDRFNDERWKLRVRSCYCSIFDECWTIEGTQAKPVAVKQCPTDWVVYSERRSEVRPTR
jgi:hypothetical protein